LISFVNEKYDFESKDLKRLGTSLDKCLRKKKGI
jgi:hypothetical protein